MINERPIEELMKLTIGEIRELEKHHNRIADVIDRQKEHVAFYINEQKIKEDWAEKFLEEFNNETN